MPLLQPQEMEKMKSKEYWQKRYMLIEGLNNTQGINVKADIDKAFRMAENGIQSEIEKWYSRIADNNGVSISKARQMLTNRELEEFKWDLADYIKYGEENNLNGKWIKELENASGRWHINRLEALKLRVQQKAEEAFGNEVDSIDNFARDAYMRGYYRTAYEIQKGLGLGWNVGVLDDAAIDEIIKKPWCPDGKNFSSRIWTRKSQMVDELHRELLRTTLLGEHPTKAIDRMLKYVDNSFGNARHAAGRLAMTEAAYFGSKGQQDSFNMLGVEEYEIVATLDNSTSKICREMDGKHFPMSEYKAGVTAPPFHPYCRTCTCPYFDDEFTEKDIRSARNEEGEVYHIPADMKYEEWKKSMVDGKTENLTVLSSDGKMKKDTFSGALNPNSAEASKHAIKYYESVRKMTSDCEAISNKTGYPLSFVKDVKEHLFMTKHDLGNGVPEYFFPDYEIAQSWQRLMDSKMEIQPHDLILLEHEHAEFLYMKQGLSQAQAHKKAEQKYNYSKALQERK